MSRRTFPSRIGGLEWKIMRYPPDWCVASTAEWASAGGGVWPGDKRCVHLPRSAGLRQPPYTTEQTAQKNAGSPSVTSEEAEAEREKTLRMWKRDNDQWSIRPTKIKIQVRLIYIKQAPLRPLRVTVGKLWSWMMSVSCCAKGHLTLSLSSRLGTYHFSIPGESLGRERPCLQPLTDKSC